MRELLGEAKQAAREAQARGARTLRADHLALGAGLALASEEVTPFIGFRGAAPPAPVTVSPAGPTPDRSAVEAALASQAGDVSAAARVLGVHRTQLYRLMRRWGMEPAPEE